MLFYALDFDEFVFTISYVVMRNINIFIADSFRQLQKSEIKTSGRLNLVRSTHSHLNVLDTVRSSNIENETDSLSVFIMLIKCKMNTKTLYYTLWK